MAIGRLSRCGEPEMILKVTIFLTRLVLGGLFIYAGAIKISDPIAFAGSIAGYRLLPYAATYVVASVLPWMEILCGLLLMTGVMVRASLFLLFMLNTVFIAALTSAAVRGLSIDCGCFKTGQGETSPMEALGRDVVIAAALVFLLWATQPVQAASSQEPPPSS